MSLDPTPSARAREMTARPIANRAESPAVATNGAEATEMPAPLTLTLPWAVLVRDNARHGLSRGRIVLTKRYREALEAAQMIVMHGMKHRDPLTVPVALVATFHEPDQSRRRDVTNYAKLLCDALEPFAILDDSQIDDARYVRGAVDATDPRVVVTLTPCPPSVDPVARRPVRGEVGGPKDRNTNKETL